MKEKIMSRLVQLNQFLKKYHLVKWTFFITLVCCVCFSAYLLFLAKTTDVKALKSSLEQTTIIYDDKNQQAGELLNQKGTYVSLDEVSPYIVDALLATEDKRFYEHSGIDYIGIARAMVGYVFSGFRVVGGGSTLTQQLAKNAYLTQQQTLIRKAQELFLALEIERQYSKDDILTMYLNHAYFGHGVWGIEDASQKYFGTSAKYINLEQAATLVGILKGPSYYNPINQPNNALNRRQTILGLMLEEGKITRESYDMASQQELHLIDGYNKSASYQYPYFFDAVIEEVIAQHGIDEESLLTKGYKIYTTLNQVYQKQLDAAYQYTGLFPDAADGTLVQSASVLLDAKTGAVMSLVGGRGEHLYRGFNRATQMHRQPGSTIKPLAVYTPALENGYGIEDMVLDEEKAYGTENYTPKNWNFETVGQLPMYQALAQSKNTSAVWLMDKIGLHKSVATLKKFGITVEKEDENLSLALGGMTKGVTPLQLASAYTAFAHAGARQEPYFVTKIEDATGQVIFNRQHTNTTRVMSEQIATDMTKMMLGVFEEGGTGYARVPNGLQIAGKTGTTEHNRDQWSVAYTPDFVFTSWMGFDKANANRALSTAYNNSIHPYFNQAINNVIAVSPQTPFQSQSVQSIIQQEKEADWFGKAVDSAKNFGGQVRDQAVRLWDRLKGLFTP